MTATVVDLAATAQALVAPGKGILSDDRLWYRRMLCTMQGIGQYSSGMILFDDNLRREENDDAGDALVDLGAAPGMIPGIKVDRGAIPLPGFPGGKVTEGLDGLGRRADYRQRGARFTKGRTVISVELSRPSSTWIAANAAALGWFAALSQEAELVPVTKPTSSSTATTPSPRTTTRPAARSPPWSTDCGNSASLSTVSC